MKSGQPTLFPLEASGLARSPGGKGKLHAFMLLHGIVTHGMPGKLEGDEAGTKWVAVKVPHKRLDNGKPMKKAMSLPEMFAWFGRLLEEGGWTGYGRTEAEAVEAVCKERGIEFKL